MWHSMSKFCFDNTEKKENNGPEEFSLVIPTTPAKLCTMQYGPRLNTKTVLSTYGDFHVKDKTAVRTSYL